MDKFHIERLSPKEGLLLEADLDEQEMFGYVYDRTQDFRQEIDKFIEASFRFCDPTSRRGMNPMELVKLKQGLNKVETMWLQDDNPDLGFIVNFIRDLRYRHSHK
jgi:hypothetical protein